MLINDLRRVNSAGYGTTDEYILSITTPKIPHTNTMEKYLQNMLHSSLFWDTAANHIDIDRNSRFIIERVVSRGSLDDWKTILAFYGKDKVQKEVLLIRSLDPKSLAYLSVFFNISKSQFRCYN